MAGSIAATLASAQAAEATPFTLTSITINSYGPPHTPNSNSGLEVDHATTITLPKTVNLTPGQQESFNLFAISTPEQSLELDDYLQKTISILFNFSIPTVTGTLTGVTGSLGIGGFGIGYVNWNGPLALPFGNNGLFSITLSDAVFGLNNQIANIVATISYDIASASVGTQDSAPVPEPASLLLLGTGLLAVARHQRKKKKEE